MQPRFIIRQQLTALVNKYTISTANQNGEVDDALWYVQQKRLSMKEKVTFYSDEAHSVPAFTFRAEKVMDVHGRYFVEDASGTGLGMFRKDFSAVSSWAKFDNSNYASLQQSIISYAAEMLKPGGLLVYSTCTFNTAENEEVIDEFLNNNPHFELANIDKHYAVSDGFSICSAENGDGKTFKNNTSNCARLWPHKLMGEGHFAALLRKKDGKECDKLSDKYTDTAASTDCDAFFDFLSKYINCSKQEFISKFESGRLTNRNGNIYIDPIVIDFPTNFKVAKIGLYLGTIKNNIFEPSHSMAMALKMKDFNNVINFNANSAEVIKYLKGETLIIDKPGKGYHVVCVDGYPLGWGKLQDGILKNLYPKGWRKMR